MHGSGQNVIVDILVAKILFLKTAVFERIPFGRYLKSILVLGHYNLHIRLISSSDAQLNVISRRICNQMILNIRQASVEVIFFYCFDITKGFIQQLGYLCGVCPSALFQLSNIVAICRELTESVLLLE